MSRFVFWETPPEVLARAMPLYAELAALRMEWTLVKLALKYRPDQPRVPAGNADGGQWTGDGQTDRLATNEPRKPPVVLAVPMYGIDPLDPKNLNKPPTPGELADAQKTLDSISNMDAAQLAKSGKKYKNLPSLETGAVLPPSPTGYMSFPVGSRSGSARRFVIDTFAGAVYYTNNHYLSFYHFNVTPGK